LSGCTIQNIEAYERLTPAELARTFESPCGYGEVTLESVLTRVDCSEC